MSRPLVEVTSDYGRIGPVAWVNSNTMPHSPLMYFCEKRLVRRWGGFTLRHHPSIRFWDEVDA